MNNTVYKKSLVCNDTVIDFEVRLHPAGGPRVHMTLGPQLEVSFAVGAAEAIASNIAEAAEWVKYLQRTGGGNR